MKQQKMWKVLAGALGFSLIALLLLLWNGTAGNPISAWIATQKIEAYVQETYPGQGLSVRSAHYNFKIGGYSCLITSPTSQDTTFSIHYGGGTIRDEYEWEVGNRFSTYRRLDRELDQLVEDIIAKKFPHKVNLVTGTLKSGEDMSGDLTLDMPFDRYHLPLPVEVVVWVDTEDVSYEEAARLLLELDGVFQGEQLPVERYSLRLSDVAEYDENGNPVYDHQREEVNISDFPAARLVEENLPRVLEDHQRQWEREADALKSQEPMDQELE